MMKRVNLNNKKGFTLLEVLIVILILGILSTVVYPSFSNVVARSQKRVCITNCSRIERGYSVYLDSNNKEHNLIFFEQYLQEVFGNRKICPNDGEISYGNGKVYCTFHGMLDDNTEDNENDDEDNGDVPFL